MSLADGFEPLRSALEQAGIRYAVGGSWASTAFGEPRFTNDVDILAEFTQENLAEFLRRLPKTFCGCGGGNQGDSSRQSVQRDSHVDRT